MLSKSKLKAYEEAEKIDAMGQDSDKKAAKAVIEVYDEQEKEEKEELVRKLEVLADKRKLVKAFSYMEQLAINLANQLKEEGFPRGYHWKVEILDNPRAIQLHIFSADRKFSRIRKFKVTAEPKYDNHACTIFAMWAGDSVLKEIDNAKITKGGIYLPN